ncbi:unnamed protein product [Linum trigynum]|uniref:Uncharacterized protein n=1 Tax=Linum trigynum TaxID=586398 RepID=A0AAV2D030_9ROSI
MLGLEDIAFFPLKSIRAHFVFFKPPTTLDLYLICSVEQPGDCDSYRPRCSGLDLDLASQARLCCFPPSLHCYGRHFCSRSTSLLPARPPSSSIPAVSSFRQ